MPVVLLLAGLFSVSHAEEETTFTNVEKDRFGFVVPVRIPTESSLYVKYEDGTIVRMKFSKPTVAEKGRTVSESTNLDWNMVQLDAIRSGQKALRTTYDADPLLPGGKRYMRRLNESHKFAIQGLEFEWFYGGDSVAISVLGSAMVAVVPKARNARLELNNAQQGEDGDADGRP